MTPVSGRDSKAERMYYTSTAKQWRLQSTEKLAEEEEEERKKGADESIRTVPGGCDDEEEVGDPRAAAGPPGRALPQERRPPHLRLAPRLLARSSPVILEQAAHDPPTRRRKRGEGRLGRRRDGAARQGKGKGCSFILGGRNSFFNEGLLGGSEPTTKRAATSADCDFHFLVQPRQPFSFCARGWRRSGGW
jgi:hypothetical protein